MDTGKSDIYTIWRKKKLNKYCSRRDKNIPSGRGVVEFGGDFPQFPPLSPPSSRVPINPPTIRPIAPKLMPMLTLIPLNNSNGQHQNHHHAGQPQQFLYMPGGGDFMFPPFLLPGGPQPQHLHNNAVITSTFSAQQPITSSIAAINAGKSTPAAGVPERRRTYACLREGCGKTYYK